MKFYPWPEIQNAHNLRRALKQFPELLQGGHTVTYRAKVKVDGTNSGIQIYSDGSVTCQSRNKVVTPQDDNMGFAKFVELEKEYWKSLAQSDCTVIIYGEWCGKGINKNMAICQVPWKNFAVFAIHLKANDENVEDKFIIEPQEIAKTLLQPQQQSWCRVEDHPFGVGFEKWVTDTEFKCSTFAVSQQLCILPWYSQEFTINWLNEAENVQSQLDVLNKQVQEIVICDPWVKEYFSINGSGEGLVCYPTSHLGKENFINLAFKAKGEPSQTSKTSLPAQANPEKIQDLNNFLTNVVTVPRLEQGVRAQSNGELNFDNKKIGQFLTWVVSDVLKECQSEILELGIEEKELEKPIKNYARQWFLNKMKNLV